MNSIPDLMAQMTLEEKASLCSGLNFWFLKGIERLGIPSIMVTDGPHGLRRQIGAGDHVGLHESEPATCFPTASALAASWNRQLILRVGEALAEECRHAQVGVLLGPGANIKRSPLCGRNFEYFSEDPLLSGQLASSYIQGLQSRGIGASLKHYCVNNQEYRRLTIDAVVDERALREIYLAGFEIAVREAQPWTVMCAYNKINGTFAAENSTLMNAILKEEWGHQGLVVTDWGAMNDRVAGLKAGVELEMPGTFSGNDELIAAAVRDGELDQAVLDEAVARILRLIGKADAALSHSGERFDAAVHHALARQAAAEAAVLLKNDGSVLPLAEHQRVALLGRFAKDPSYQGAGSSLVNPFLVDNLYSELIARVTEENLVYAPGYDVDGDQLDDALIAAAVVASEAADVVVICAGLTDLYEVEGLDREHLRLPPGHDALIAAVAAVHPRVVVVLSNGSPVVMPWLAEVEAVIEGYLGGQAAAGALADILYGLVNPSGKLAETFPLRLEDTPCYHYFPGGPAIVEYRESLYVGYRYYDSVAQPVLFPFGFGLSYTTFEYSALQLSQERIVETDELVVTFMVSNTGTVAGKEIVQLYVRDVEASTFRPDKELKGFDKVELAPGEAVAVVISLTRRAFAFFDPMRGDWVVEAGAFDILVGASSQDIRLRATVEVSAPEPAVAAAGSEMPAAYLRLSKGRPVSREEFESLLGHPVPANEADAKGQYSVNTPLEDLHGSLLGRLLNRLLRQQMDKQVAGLEHSPTGLLMRAIVREGPLRWMLMARDRRINNATLNALVMMLNGNTLAGVAAMSKALSGKKRAGD
jgi:beta-glucosidase